jgi:hypothetical protein
LRWLWNAWAEDAKPLVRLGNPCTLKDHDLFTTSTVFTVGNGEKDLFLGSAWLHGMLPKDIALKIYEIASEKKCTVKKALDNELLVSHINTQNGLSVEQITQFYKLWEILQGVHIYHDTPDTIAWKFGKNKWNLFGLFGLEDAFFMGHTTSLIPSMVWKPWAPP